jgi:hypothetical protein
MKLFKIAGIAIAVAVVASVAMYLGDLRRYIKMEMM